MAVKVTNLACRAIGNGRAMGAQFETMRARIVSLLLLSAVPFAAIAPNVMGCSAGGSGDTTNPNPDASVGESGSDTSGTDGHQLFDGDNLEGSKSDASIDASCPGVGVRCGGALGMDPTKLYACKDGSVSGVARDCKGTCITATDGTQDRCPCPDGDGNYCGERVGGEKNRMYACKDGHISEIAQCAPTCTPGTGPTADKCAPCSSGNGAYCGGPIGADTNTLYDCKDGVLTVKQKCGGACQVKPPGTPDTCGPCPSGDGLYCGAPVGLDPNTLYTCKGGVFTVSEKCGSTCHVAPPGVNDYCEGTGLLCSNVQWWNASITYGPYVSYGWWDTDLAIGDRSRVQLRHDSQLYKTGVYGWGYMPEFVDQATGKKFRFLHLHPDSQWATAVGTIYHAGYVVGLSGGGTADTGYGTYSTGPHLCVQSLDTYRNTFPAGTDACH